MTTYRLINWWCRFQIVTTEMCFNVICFIFIVSHVFLCFSHSKCAKRAEFGRPESDLTCNSWAESQIRASVRICKQKSRGTKGEYPKDYKPKSWSKGTRDNKTKWQSHRQTHQLVFSGEAEKTGGNTNQPIQLKGGKEQRQEDRHART